MVWFLDLDIKLQVALIGVVSALSVILIKDVGLHFWREARADRKTAKEIYRNYSDPLLRASISLFMRFDETLIASGRGAYLKSSGSENYFDKYKFESTLYRLAELIGWVRAYRREHSFLPFTGKEHLKSLEKAISQFEAALADGAHVEIQRVKGVSELWNISLPEESEELSRISVKVEQVLKSVGATTSGEQILLVDLEYSEQVKLCQEISNYLCDEAKVNHLSNEIVLETTARAVRSLSIREAWLYRDFQSGIGDLMIFDVSGANRRFDVLGFKDFESLLQKEEPESKRWMYRLTRIFDGVDISGADEFDARVQMLEHIFLASANILIALAEIDKGRSLFVGKILVRAKTIRDDGSWRKGSQ